MSFLEKLNSTYNIMLKTLSNNLSMDDIGRLALNICKHSSGGLINIGRRGARQVRWIVQGNI